MLGDADGLADACALGLTLELALGEGQGDGVALAETVGPADAEGVAVATEVAVGVARAVGPAAGDGLAVAVEQRRLLGALVGAINVVLTPVGILGPLRISATGTTSMPTSTVITKAAAPHSRRQKAQDAFRVRALRPGPAEAYSGY